MSAIGTAIRVNLGTMQFDLKGSSRLIGPDYENGIGRNH